MLLLEQLKAATVFLLMSIIIRARFLMM